MTSAACQRWKVNNLPRRSLRSIRSGGFHLDIAEGRTEEGKLYLFVGIDRTSTFAYAELHAQYGKLEAAQFLRNLIAAVPYNIHTILTDNGIPSTPLDQWSGRTQEPNCTRGHRQPLQ